MRFAAVSCETSRNEFAVSWGVTRTIILVWLNRERLCFTDGVKKINNKIQNKTLNSELKVTTKSKAELREKQLCSTSATAERWERLGQQEFG